MSMSDKTKAAKPRKAQTEKKMSPALSVGDVKTQFAEATTLKDAVGLIRNAGALHKTYSHYTTLRTLLPLIEHGEWWLTRATSKQFDDLIESRKYGEKETLRRLYFTCFSYQQSESAAMWRLYSDCGDDAVRIILSKTVLKTWVEGLMAKELRVYPIRGGEVDRSKCLVVKSASVYDVLYASVEDGDGACVRARSLCWNDCFTKAIDDLREEKRSAGASGVLKDYEWRFEYESRLAVELAEDAGVDCDRIAVEVPKDVLAKMTFTRSPWVDYEKRIADAMRDARVGRAMKLDFVKPSVLSGALEKWRSK